MNKNILNKLIKIDNKPLYMTITDTIVGINKFKSKFILNMNNNFIHKKYNNLNKISYEYTNIINKYSTINTDLFKKNTIQFNNKRLFIIKTNENKNFYKKNM